MASGAEPALGLVRGGTLCGSVELGERLRKGGILMQLIHELEQYPDLERIFSLVQDWEDSVFLDSSLENDLGRYSIIALHPYLKLVKAEKFTVNGQVLEESFEDYIKMYLREHREENCTSLPLTSGAVGYFSYEYGRKKEGVGKR